ncbi:PAS domain-containing protein [Pelagibius sp. Alg239-R121]|uniref:PAS domain-containing protein n=1 Tax=Pelagibius sp. Alg239-R121 TaxID=2993448 RepID=UPI0024A73041|nr:PAS domain-containing protein [Pelagibius sp. Alg239-R121]
MPRVVCPLAPLWSDFDPMAVPSVLEWMVVLERRDESLEGHVVRLMGESVKNLFASNMTGQNLSEALSDKDLAKRWQDLNSVAEAREPSFHVSKVPVKAREFISICRGCFPFCDEKGAIVRLVIVAAPTGDSGFLRFKRSG